MDIHAALTDALNEARLDGRDQAIKDILFSLASCIGDDEAEDAGILAAIEMINANFSTT